MPLPRTIIMLTLAIAFLGTWRLHSTPPRADAERLPERPGAPPARPPARFGQTVLLHRYARPSKRVVVRFTHHVTAAEKRRLVRSVGGHVDATVPAVVATVINVPDDRVDSATATLALTPGVDYAEPEAPVSATGYVTPSDALWPNQWGLKLIGLQAVWGAASGAPPTIAVVDSGVDPSLPGLQGRLVPGIDLVNHDADPTDDNGHGTSVAGIIASELAGPGGAGVCPSCLIMPVKVLAANGSGDSSTVAAGIIWAADHGARVINVSLGGPEFSQVLADADAYAAAKGAIVVAAAGNNGSTAPFYPADDPAVVSVGATDSSDILYDWSNRGPWVSVAAPGCNVAPSLGGTYVQFCGTSSATPIVSGLVGLAFELNASATPDTVKTALAAGHPVANVAHGRVDAGAVAHALGVQIATQPTPTLLTTVVGTWRVHATAQARRLSQTLAAGPTTFSLQARGRTRVRLYVRAFGGTRVLAASGVATARAKRTLPAGRYLVVVTAAPPTLATLRVTRSVATTPAVK